MRRTAQNERPRERTEEVRWSTLAALVSLLARQAVAERVAVPKCHSVEAALPAPPLGQRDKTRGEDEADS